MSRVTYELDKQSGSAARHFVVVSALIILCYFAVHALYGRIDSALDGRRNMAEQPSGHAADLVQAGASSSHIDKEAITRRNLFLPSSGRQGGTASRDPVGSGEGAEQDLLLVGTIIESGGRNRAVILDVEDKKQVMLGEGDMIKGVSVRQIYSGKVVISRQGQNELLDIAEAVKIRAASMDMASGDTTASTLGTTSLLPKNSLQEDDESEDERLRVDLNKLKKKDDRIIVKGRLSDNI
jgi:general secretion pathway protein C